MTTRINPLMATGVALASAGALVVATPAIGANLDAANTAGARLSSLSTPFELLSKSQWQGFVGSSESDDADDDHGYGDGYGDSHSDDGDDDHGGGIGNFIADFLAANQAGVLAVTALIPVFYLGPVAVGNSLLATAYYDGYNGSAPGLEGVVSYVTSQFGVAPTNLLQGVVLGLTSLIPQFNIGPVAVGHSLLATAFFNGDNGSATGLPGLISYVTSQLGIQAAPAAAVSAEAVAVPAPSAASRSAVPAAAASQDSDAAEAPSVSASVAAVPTEAAGDSAAESKVDSGSVSGIDGRGVASSAKAGSADARGKARSARSAAKSAADAS